MTWPLVVLGVLSVLGGLVGTPARNAFADWFHFPGPVHHEAFVPWIAVLSIAIAVAGIGLGFSMYSRAIFGLGVIDPLARLGPLYRAAEKRFFIDDFYMNVFIRPVQYPIARFVYNVLDKRVVDGAVNGAAAGAVRVATATRRVDERGVDGAVNGVAWITDKLSFLLRRVQTGNVQGYAAGLFVGLIVLAAVLVIRGGI
jgi:NADH:ubiquinone oxidoreductase subunit 5 (subunit L)/multisubunit Na+/H+ antiporter MnhA subunit